MSDAVWDAFQRYQELEKEGRYGEAIPFAQEVVRLAEEEFGSEHEHVGISLNNLALLYRDQGRYAAAEPLYKRSLAIREKALGPDHPNVALGLNRLAGLYYAQGRYADAEAACVAGITIDEAAAAAGEGGGGGGSGPLRDMLATCRKETCESPAVQREMFR